MKHLTASTSPSPFSGENWFDPLEDAIRFRVRAFIEAVVAEEAFNAAARPRVKLPSDRRFRSPASACSMGMAVRRNGGARPSRPTSGWALSS